MLLLPVALAATFATIEAQRPPVEKCFTKQQEPCLFPFIQEVPTQNGVRELTMNSCVFNADVGDFICPTKHNRMK